MVNAAKVKYILQNSKLILHFFEKEQEGEIEEAEK